jgi:hypothetical protein
MSALVQEQSLQFCCAFLSVKPVVLNDLLFTQKVQLSRKIVKEQLVVNRISTILLSPKAQTEATGKL